MRLGSLSDQHMGKMGPVTTRGPTQFHLLSGLEVLCSMFDDFQMECVALRKNEILRSVGKHQV